MGLFVCDICGCVENTALGFYWGLALAIDDNSYWFSDPKYQNKALCSECKPLTFEDGTPCGTGKWHGKFEKKKWEGQCSVVNRPYFNQIKPLQDSR